MNRPGIVLAALALASTAHLPTSAFADEDGFGLHMGVRVGEVTQNSAVFWTRLCAQPRKNDGPESPPRKAKEVDLSTLQGYLPGEAGKVIFTVMTDAEPSYELAPISVTADSDFAAKLTATGLKPATKYRVIASAVSADGDEASAESTFVTAADPESPQEVRFAVLTGQEYEDRDAGTDGFLAYDAMRNDDLKFLVYTGDSVYYDRPMFYANSIAKMRHFWHRMYSFPKAIAFAVTTPAYYEVDDHDILDNDSWPGKKSRVLKPITMDDGLAVLREQTPIGDRPYRSVRWGKDLEVWLMEGRLYRSPNPEPDGPSKTIWGATQKQWLTESLQQSDATFKVVVSPTPIVGPDRSKGKKDNHANEGFATEGAWVREMLTSDAVGRVIVCCGDRHWQYHSVDPTTGLHEFSCGPLSDEHAGGAPKEQPEWQKHRRVKGGYLTVKVDRPSGNPTLTAALRSVSGERVYEWKTVAE